MDKEAIKKAIAGVLNQFFQEEQGNRITSNNLEGLAGKLFNSIDQMPVPEPKEDVAGSKDKSK